MAFNKKLEKEINDFIERYDKRFSNLSQPKQAEWAKIQAVLLNTKKTIEIRKAVSKKQITDSGQKIRKALKKAEVKAKRLAHIPSTFERDRCLVVGMLVGIACGITASGMFYILHFSTGYYVWPIIGAVFGLVFAAVYYQHTHWK